MKLDAYIRTLNYFLLLTVVKSEANQVRSLTVSNIKNEWKSLCEYLVTIMNQSQIMKENGRLEVNVFLLNYPAWNRNYDGFQ